MTVHFSSDSHYGHRNILTYSKRPFDNVEEHDEMLIKNWNDVVEPGDLIYHLGDFALCDVTRATAIAKRLHGTKYLIFGNHDKRLRKDAAFCSQWIWCRDLTSIEVGDQKIVLCHYALRTWHGSHRGAWSLYGHSHGSLKDDPYSLSLDVGVDCWDYTPVSFETIRQRMAKKTFRPVDHHGDDTYADAQAPSRAK